MSGLVLVELGQVMAALELTRGIHHCQPLGVLDPVGF
jgi:hypothetical protein